VERDTVLPLRGPDLREFHPAIRSIYERRLGSAAAAEAFLLAAGTTVPLPCDLAGVDDACDRIERALDTRERIMVFGHDDPDGITSAAIVIETLERLGGRVEGYIPNRAVEGHGLYPDLVRHFAERGAKLIVTTDGCTMNRAEADLAGTLGMDVLVTDHHEAAGDRPTVARLVNPKVRPGRTDCTDLTGAGVAALVMRELLHRRPDPDLTVEPDDSDDLGTDVEPAAVVEPEDEGDAPAAAVPSECTDQRFFRLLDLVALGTIADVGDLGRNNRAMVVRGLTAVARGDRPAISLARRALEIGPPAVLRLEKASRLAALFASVPSREGKSPGLDALLGRSNWAGALDDLLRSFLKSEVEIEDGIRAVTECAASAVESGAPLVVRADTIAPRSMGKAAGRLASFTGRPAAVLRMTRDHITGELRGADGTDVDLVGILSTFESLLTSWGGHRAAAGFSAEPARADAIATALSEAFARVPQAPLPVVSADATISRGDVNASFSRSLRAAMPFGKGNPTPVFRIRDYREGGTQAEGDRRDRVTALLEEPEFPDRPEGKVPLVTFHARGAGGLRATFAGWTDPEGGSG
jgi:single-stranded-DNA-specific exonuclease